MIPPVTDFYAMDHLWRYLNDEVEGLGYYKWTKEHFVRYCIGERYASIRQEDEEEWELIDVRGKGHEEIRRVLNTAILKRLNTHG